MVRDEDAAAAEQARADLHTMRASDVDLVGEVAIVTDDQQRIEGDAAVARDGLQPEIIAGVEVASETHVAQTQKPRRSAKTQARGGEPAAEQGVSHAPGRNGAEL